MTHRFWITLLVLSVWLAPLGPAQTASAQGSGRNGVHPPAAPSAGPMGGGTVSPCNETELDARLADGGTVTFSCGGPFSFFLTTTKTITQSTTVDGAGASPWTAPIPSPSSASWRA